MKFSAILLLPVLLCGCARTDPIEEAVVAVDEQVIATERAAFALHSSLPKECLTEAVDAQFEALFADIKSVRRQITSVYSTAQSQLSLYRTREKTHALINIVLVCGCLVLLFSKFKQL